MRRSWFLIPVVIRLYELNEKYDGARIRTSAAVSTRPSPYARVPCNLCRHTTTESNPDPSYLYSTQVWVFPNQWPLTALLSWESVFGWCCDVNNVAIYTRLQFKLFLTSNFASWTACLELTIHIVVVLSHLISAIMEMFLPLKQGSWYFYHMVVLYVCKI